MRGSRRARLTLVLLLLTAFTLTALDYNSAQSGPLASLRRGIDTVFGPIQNALGGAANSVGNAFGGLGSTASDNRRLKQQVADLQGQLNADEGNSCLLDQYLALDGLVRYARYAVKHAQVVAVGPAGSFERTATIDVGSRDGIKVDMTVVTGAGLAGQVIKVSPANSTVLLINDTEFVAGARLVNQGSVGFADGTGGSTMEFLVGSMLHVVRGTQLQTSGSSFAAGVPIGRVTAVTTNTAGGQNITIAPFVDPTRLELVGVITTLPAVGSVKSYVPVAPTGTPTPCAPAVPQGAIRPTPSPAAKPSPHITPSASPTP